MPSVFGGQVIRRLWMLLLVGLYAALIAALVAWWRHYWPGASWTWIVTVLGLGVTAQILFLVLPGKPSYVMPIAPRRLLGPALIGGTLMGILSLGLFAAIGAMLPYSGLTLTFLGLVLLSWVSWTAIARLACVHSSRLSALAKITKILIAGSLTELLVSVPSHLFFGRRTGCMTGLTTTFAVGAGFAVLVWALGPGFVLMLWLHPEALKDTGRCPGCGYILRGLSQQRCPECGRPFTWQEIRATPDQMDFQG